MWPFTSSYILHLGWGRSAINRIYWSTILHCSRLKWMNHSNKAFHSGIYIKYQMRNHTEILCVVAYRFYVVYISLINTIYIGNFCSLAVEDALLCNRAMAFWIDEHWAYARAIYMIIVGMNIYLLICRSRKTFCFAYSFVFYLLFPVGWARFVFPIHLIEDIKDGVFLFSGESVVGLV